MTRTGVFMPHDPQPHTATGHLDALGVDVRLAVIEYGDCLAEYGPRADDPAVPRQALDDYAVALDVLALARRVPTEDVPALLGVGTRALLRFHRAVHA
ncbi:hypothetical protein ACL02U_06360 [Streptomyces sp. MS06]|uniref:hypothetical protein n=1 Tax=Streptomyces sp. MS06 TaxID=3385974 RepID=UPI0039A343EA